MPSQRQWVFNPDSGGRKIPPTVQAAVERDLRAAAEKHFAGRYTRLAIRFRSQFCYIDAYTEPPPLTPSWPPANWPETREAYMERLRNTPTHLCRLRFFGPDRWGFAFYTYSHEKYELSMYPTGDFFGTPTEAFLVAANVYLNG